MRNDFLLELLALQQDGRSAISAPNNWTTRPPLLEVPTDVDHIVDRLYSAILSNNGQNETAGWHFFIGSPGNGKSAAMGKLCRNLLAGNACQIRDEDDIAIQNLEPTAIPYAIYVYEGSNRFSSVQIVQDASVVRKPFSSEIDPARELLNTLQAAWGKAISLIVCTNRGVLEKAHRDNHTNHNINSTPWFKILSNVLSADTSLSGELPAEREFENKKSVFKRVKVSYSHLDNRSLLLGKDSFDQLLQSAAGDYHWKSCDSCTSREMCPFRANREWIAKVELRERVLLLLRRAEVFSGQVIVFREALAIVSLVLAGCPRDYEGMHPCDWVHSKNASGDIFALATRRIYMCLFASHCPYGLEAPESLRKQQLQELQALFDVTGEENTDAKRALRQVIGDRAPSTDVGVTRLLGRDGVIAEIDPCRESLPVEFYESWDADFESLFQNNSTQFGAIELACIAAWAALERGLEFASGHSASNAHWALRRWSSNFLMHLGALVEGLSAWDKELDSFAKLLDLVGRSPAQQAIEEKRLIRDLNLQLEKLLDAVAGKGEQGTIPLSETVTLSGAWVKNKLKPKTVAREASGSVSLAIEFGEGGHAERAVLAALMYLWLTRRASGRLDPRCFPQELLSGATDARIRAAAKGKYAFENNDVELIIDTERNELFRLSRFDGAVDVSYE